MICSCGRETTSSEHEVKTISTATEWGAESNSQLPVKVHQQTCPGCGRSGWILFDVNGDIIFRRGI